MSQRSVFQAKMVEVLGGPLMAAVSAASPQEEPPGRIAAHMAELMGRAVQLGINLSAGMNLKGEDPLQADAVRLALTALAGRLLGDVFRETGTVPDEASLRKWTPALEALLVFADRFAPSPAAIMRLDRLEPGLPSSTLWPVDENQATMQYMQAFVPVVAEIGAFSFGRPEKKLIQDVADRLSTHAETMAGRLFKDVDGAEGLQLKLGIAKALAQIYVECHREEKSRLQAMDAAARPAVLEGGAVALDTLWVAFDMRAAMLETLAQGLFGTGGQVPRTKAVSPKAYAPIAPVTPPIPPTMPSFPARNGDAPVSPMGFFRPGAKKAADSPQIDDSGGAE